MAVFVYSSKAAFASELAGFAKSAGKQAIALAFSQEQADQLANCGADQVLCVKGASDAPECYAKSLAAYLVEQGAEGFVVESTVVGRQLAASVAGYAGWGMASDVVSATFQQDGLSIERMQFGGSVVAQELVSCPSVVTVGQGKFEPVSGQATVEAVELEADVRMQVLETQTADSGVSDIAEAKRIVAIGMGVDPADVDTISQLAADLDAELGCTRDVAEVRKVLPVERYIGLSGKEVAPDYYLALGLSGQVQHTCGVRGSKIIAAVNSDEHAPVFAVADYGIVGDYREFIPLFAEAVKTL